MNKIILFTGQPGAGKTTLCNFLVPIIESTINTRVIVLDGDMMRAVTGNYDYSNVGRSNNFIITCQLAEYLLGQNFMVLVALVSPSKRLRDMLDRSKFVEVYVHTTDIRGREHYHVPNYEPPVNDPEYEAKNGYPSFIDVDTGQRNPSATANLLWNEIKLRLNR